VSVPVLQVSNILITIFLLSNNITCRRACMARHRSSNLHPYFWPHHDNLVLHSSSTCLEKLAANPSLARLVASLQPSPNLALQKLVSNSQLVVCTVFSRRAITLNVSVPVLQVSNILITIFLSSNNMISLLSLPRCRSWVPCCRDPRARR
jgi:hypothetical protein